MFAPAQRGAKRKTDRATVRISQTTAATLFIAPAPRSVNCALQLCLPQGTVSDSQLRLKQTLQKASRFRK